MLTKDDDDNDDVCCGAGGDRDDCDALRWLTHSLTLMYSLLAPNSLGSNNEPKCCKPAEYCCCRARVGKGRGQRDASSLDATTSTADTAAAASSSSSPSLLPFFLFCCQSVSLQTLRRNRSAALRCAEGAAAATAVLPNVNVLELNFLSFSPSSLAPFLLLLH